MVLARMAGQLADQQGRAHGPLSERGNEASDLIPVLANGSPMDSPTQERFEAVVLRRLLEREQAVVGQIPDAGRKPEAEQVTEREDMIRVAGSIGVVLLHFKIGM